MPHLRWHEGSTCDTINQAHACYLVQVLLDGEAVGRLDRNGPQNMTLAAQSAAPFSTRSTSASSAFVSLEVIVEAVGRSNQGWRFDTKGLASPNVTWAGRVLTLNSGFP
jgi:hypothetical protein